MKFGHPLISTELRGALGGVVGSVARGGVGYFRARITPSNPKTVAQGVARAIASSIAAAWRDVLNGDQRAAWEDIAAENASGIDAMIKGNFQRMISGGAMIVDAPASAALIVNPVTATPAIDASDDLLTFAVDPTEVNIGWNVYATAPQSSSRAARQYWYQYLGLAAVTDGAASLDFSGLDHPLDSITAGGVAYIRLVPFGNGSTKLGQVGESQEFRVTAGA